MKVIKWRKATEEEIKLGLDDKFNNGMIADGEEEIVEEKTDLSKIDIDSLTDEQILKLKARFGL